MELVEQLAHQLIGKPVFVAPLGVAEDAVERVGVGPLDFPQGGRQGKTDVLSALEDIVPVGTFRHLKAVLLSKGRVADITFGVLQSLVVLLLPHVADAFEEEQRKDVRLEVRRVDGAAQDVCGVPQAGLQFGEAEPALGEVKGGLCHWAFLALTSTS